MSITLSGLPKGRQITSFQDASTAGQLLGFTPISLLKNGDLAHNRPNWKVGVQGIYGDSIPISCLWDSCGEE